MAFKQGVSNQIGALLNKIFIDHQSGRTDKVCDALTCIANLCSTGQKFYAQPPRASHVHDWRICWMDGRDTRIKCIGCKAHRTVSPFFSDDALPKWSGMVSYDI